MAWKIENGVMVRVGVSPPEVTLAVEVSEYVCAQCGRTFKTAPGLARHTTTKHG